MLLGREVIILTIDDARQMLKVLKGGNHLTKDKVKSLVELDCLELYERLVSAIKRCEED